MGIRKRIATGCVSLGILLFTAAVISYFELGVLNETTISTVDKGVTGVGYSKDLLDIMESVDIIILTNIQAKDNSKKIEISRITGEMDSITQKLLTDFKSNSAMKDVVKYSKAYQQALTQIPDSVYAEQVKWYFEKYKQSYLALSYSTKDFMVLSQEEVLEQTKLIESNAYRANMQGIMALVIAIFIIVIFYFMVDTYFIKPVTYMTTALRNYLIHKTPFEVSFEGKDEVYNLKEYIEQLIGKLKSEKRKTE